MNNDLISRSELKEAINTWDKFACLPNGKLEPFRNLEHPEMFEPYIHFRDIIKAIDGTPTVPLPDFKEGYKQAIIDGKTNFSSPQGEWIPVKTRPLTEEEKEEYPDCSFMYDCKMPEDGQQILISTKYGVEFDTCFADDGYYLDSDRDWEDVYAWQPLPEPYEVKDNDV